MNPKEYLFIRKLYTGNEHSQEDVNSSAHNVDFKRFNTSVINFAARSNLHFKLFCSIAIFLFLTGKVKATEDNPFFYDSTTCCTPDSLIPISTNHFQFCVSWHVRTDSGCNTPQGFEVQWRCLSNDVWQSKYIVYTSGTTITFCDTANCCGTHTWRVRTKCNDSTYSDWVFGNKFNIDCTQRPISYNPAFNNINIISKLRKAETPKISSIANIGSQTALKNPMSSKISGPLNELFLNRKEPGKSLVETIQKVTKNPINFGQAQISYLSNCENWYTGYDKNSYLNNFEFISNWSVANIPVTIGIRDQTWTEVSTSPFSITVRFDRDEYLQELKSKFIGKFNPSEFLSELKDPTAILKQTAEVQLKKDLQQINSQYSRLLDSKISSLGNIDNLLKKDISSLREQFLGNKFLASISTNEKLLSQLLQRKNNGEQIDTIQVEKLENSISEMRGIEELLVKVEEKKNEWKASGLISKAEEWDKLKQKRLAEIMNDPTTTIKLARKHLNLSGLQKLFLKINKLRIGQNAISSTPFSLEHFLNKGVMTEFLSNNKYLMLLNSKQSDYNSVMDLPFTNSISSNSGLAKGIQFGKGGFSKSYSHISIMSFDQTLSSTNVLTSLQPIWRSLVTTISHQMPIGEKGLITGEISRSATSFISGKNPLDSNQKLSPSNIERIFSGNNLLGSMAFSVKYNDEYSKAGLDYQVSISKTANGYNNPGNPFLNNGSTEASLRVNKSFLKNKIQVSLRSNMREFRYNESSNNRWRNTYSVIDIKWRLRKGQFITFRYTPNRMNRIENGIKQRVSSMERLSAETNITTRLGQGYYRNYLNLSYQKNGYQTGNNAVLNKSLLLSSYQSLTAGKKLFYLNLMYNNSFSISQYTWFNSSLNTESGITYQLFKKISGSSALTYNEVKMWYQQAGIRQTVSSQLSGHFNLNIYIDARKNLRLFQPLLYGSFRADIAVQYIFKK